MTLVIRAYREDDAEAIVRLSLRAWEPVFASIEDIVGPGLFECFYGDDWRVHQEAIVRRMCSLLETWVAVSDEAVVGFVALDFHGSENMGEIAMLAVDPSSQRGGVGTMLTEHAVEQVRLAGKRAVFVRTGGDPGHASARATYRKAGFVGFPAERFFRLL